MAQQRDGRFEGTFFLRREDAAIKRIMIKGSSGYCEVNDAYEDEVVLTEDSVSYERRPHPESNPALHQYRKWQYKSDSPAFVLAFREITEMTVQYLKIKDQIAICDIGETEITAVFEDGHKESNTFAVFSDFFEVYFHLIKRMIPACEETPFVLMTEEDYDEDDPEEE